MRVSIDFPVVIRNFLTGLNPNFTGIGNNHGTPSLVKLSMKRWLIMPIKNAHQTKPTLVCGMIGLKKINSDFARKPAIATPNRECVKNRCPPETRSNILPKYLPTGKFLQNGAVGWSMSGVIPPTMHANTETIAVLSVMAWAGWSKNTIPRAIIAARSCVLAVIVLVYQTHLCCEQI